jgi:hypothetical protein
MDAGTGNTFTTLHIFVDGGYLQQADTDPVSYVDLSGMLTNVQVEDLTIDVSDIFTEGTDTIKGIITMYAVASNNSYINKALSNMYYVQLVLANMIVNKEVQQGFNEISTVYFLLKAIDTYLSANPQKIEQALNAYERVLAMVEQNPTYLMDIDTDISAGSGAWIINGNYIVK